MKERPILFNDMELKKCPFCGYDADTDMGDLGGWFVACELCNCVLGEMTRLDDEGFIVNAGVFNTEQEAIEAWNRRVK